jgi:hypothetical protein
MEVSGRGQPIEGGTSAWGLDVVLENPHHIKILFTKWIHLFRDWTDPLLQPKQWKRHMSLGKWNVESV